MLYFKTFCILINKPADIVKIVPVPKHNSFTNKLFNFSCKKIERRKTSAVTTNLFSNPFSQPDTLTNRPLDVSTSTDIYSGALFLFSVDPVADLRLVVRNANGLVGGQHWSRLGRDICIQLHPLIFPARLVIASYTDTTCAGKFKYFVNCLYSYKIATFLKKMS